MQFKANYRFLLSVLILLITFSALLLLLDFWTISHITDRNADANATALAYIMQPIPDMMDNYFINDIDESMERELSATPFISYAFSTPRYPAGNPLKERIRTDLQSLSDGADAILGAFVYTAATDSFVYSPSLAAAGSPFADCEANLRDIIYNYNTGTLSRMPFYDGKHTTFRLLYHDVVLFSKDLTPNSGIASATLFAVIDMNRLASYIFKTESFKPYSRVSIQIGIYDENNAPLYQSKNLDSENAAEILFWASSETNVLKLRDSYGIRFDSDSLSCRYVFIVGRDFLSPFTQGFSVRDLIFTNIIATVIMISAAVLLIRKLTRKGDEQIAVIYNQLSFDHGNLSRMDYPEVFRQISSRISMMQSENDTLKSVLPQASEEALQMVLFRMLCGEQVDALTLETVMRYSRFGFGPGDIYVAGAAYARSQDLSNLARHNAVNRVLNETLNHSREKEKYHCIVLTLDAHFHALILSFPGETSIAQCKQVINSLIPRLTEALSRMGEESYVSFGHLYHSIQDLTFSFHEAMRQVLPPDISAAGAEDSGANAGLPPPEQPVPAGETSAADRAHGDDSMSDYIGRRAAQIVRTVSEGKQGSAEEILDRTLDTIVKTAEPDRLPDCAERLVNCTIEAIMMHVFALHEQLTVISGQLSGRIRSGLDANSLISETRRGILELCAEFSRILEKQNSPYITRTIEYIDRHYMNQDLSLEEIAEQLNIAPNYLSSLFSKTMGRKLFDYVNEVRLKKSLEEMLSTQDNINEIIDRCGFGSRRNYIRIFKKVMNTTPTAWRKEQLGKSDLKE